MGTWLPGRFCVSMEIGVGRVHNPRMDSSDLSECGRIPGHNDKRQHLGGFVSKCRAIKSLNFSA